MHIKHTHLRKTAAIIPKRICLGIFTQSSLQELLWNLWPLNGVHLNIIIYSHFVNHLLQTFTKIIYFFLFLRLNSLKFRWKSIWSRWNMFRLSFVVFAQLIERTTSNKWKKMIQIRQDPYAISELFRFKWKRKLTKNKEEETTTTETETNLTNYKNALIQPTDSATKLTNQQPFFRSAKN